MPNHPIQERKCKRRRKESDSANQPRDTFERDRGFWYEDGNVIIVAYSEREENIGFRLYKGWLSAQSEVFHDMFSLPQPASEDLPRGEASDGCPIVHVTDAPSKLRMLFAVLFSDRTYVCSTAWSGDTS